MKKITKDTYLQSVYRVILYIEQHYPENLTIEELSRVAGFSPYHFHRIFKSIIGESLGSHIRRVRLAMSTSKFLTDQSITAIAMESGYETPASFTKAFKHHFGITPREFSKRIRSTKGSNMLEPIYVNLEPIDVLCARKTGDYMTSCGEAWEMVMAFAYKQKIQHKKSLMGKEAMMFGIGHDNPGITDVDKLRCDACISLDDPSVQPEGAITVKTIAGGRYAMFLHKGAYDKLQSVYNAIGDWIVEKGVSLRDEPMFEKYLNRDPRRTKPENLRTEIYVPIAP